MSAYSITEPSNRQNKTRKCLMCGDQFPSDGPGNRVCKNCKTTQTWRDGT